MKKTEACLEVLPGPRGDESVQTRISLRITNTQQLWQQSIPITIYPLAFSVRTGAWCAFPL